MRELLAELNTALEQQRPCVYCSVVETRGSTPQKAGAAMLVFADGSQRGTLGGGCVEAEIKQRALRVLAGSGGQAEVLSFCLDDNYGWDDGLICGGRMNILADPLSKSSQAAAYYQTFATLVREGQGCTEAVIVGTAVGAAVGARYLFDAAGRAVAQLDDGPMPAAVPENLTPLARRPAPSSQHGVAFLPILPRVTLLIVGGGHVGQAVAELAAKLDFNVWVLDDRERYAGRERFPTAERLIVGDIGSTLAQVAPGLNPSHYCLIVTRGHNHDEEALYHLAPTKAGYVGMIGSKRKIRLIYEDLVAKGISAEMLARVHAPLGLEIGSQTVVEIAVSILAELVAQRNLGTTDLPPRVPVHVDTGRS